MQICKRLADMILPVHVDFSYVCNHSTCACFFIWLLKVFPEWKDISFTIQDEIFEEDENQQIDIHNVKVNLNIGH